MDWLPGMNRLNSAVQGFAKLASQNCILSRWQTFPSWPAGLGNRGASRDCRLPGTELEYSSRLPGLWLLEKTSL